MIFFITLFYRFEKDIIFTFSVYFGKLQNKLLRLKSLKIAKKDEMIFYFLSPL